MSTARPWKLYLAAEGEPRQLIADYETLAEAAWAYRDVTGSKGETIRFSVTVSLARQAGTPTARFESEGGRARYFIELSA